jgi:hypothetical protein
MGPHEAVALRAKEKTQAETLVLDLTPKAPDHITYKSLWAAVLTKHAVRVTDLNAICASLKKEKRVCFPQLGGWQAQAGGSLPHAAARRCLLSCFSFTEHAARPYDAGSPQTPCGSHCRAAPCNEASMQFLRAFSFIVLVAFLAACDQTPPSKGEPGPQGLPGERGPQGPPGPAGVSAAPVGPTSHVRMIRVNCDAASCDAECNEDEILLIAYCGAARTAPIYPTERSATCRTRIAANNPLILACVKSTSP